MSPSANIEVETSVIPSSKLHGKKELKSSGSPLPEVKAFDAASVTVDELVRVIKVAGGVVIKNMLTVEEVGEIEKDVKPWLEKDKPWANGMSLRCINFYS